MPTPVYLNGFENRVMAVGAGTGADNLLTIVTGVGLVSETTIKRGAGAASAKLAIPTTSNFTAAIRIGGSAPSPGVVVATRMTMRFYFRKSGNPSVPVDIVYVDAPTIETDYLRLNADGTLQIRVVAGASGGTSAPLNNDQWYCVEMMLGATVGRLFIDGVQAATDCVVAISQMQQYALGCNTSVTLATARDLYFDDWIIGSASSLTDTFGPTNGIVAIVPNADGTHSPATPVAGRFKDAAAVDISGSNPAWDNLDSGILTQTAERVSMPVAAGTEYLELQFGTATLPGTAPVAVQAEVALNSDGTNAFNASTRARNGAVETVIFTGDWSTGPASKWYKRAIIPVASQAELDGLTMRLGYGTAQPAAPYWEGLMFEVDLGAALTSLTVQAVPASMLMQAQDRNLLNNGGFEVDASGFGVEGAVTPARDIATAPKFGIACGKMVYAANSGNVVANVGTGGGRTAGKPVTFTFWAKVDNQLANSAFSSTVNEAGGAAGESQVASLSFNTPSVGTNESTQGFGIPTVAQPLGNVAANGRIAQSFVATASDEIESLIVYLQKVGTPADGLRCSVYTDNAGEPGTLLATQTATEASIATSAGDKLFAAPLAQSAQLVIGTTYWLVLERTTGAVDAANYYNLFRFSTNVYASGVSRIWDGSVWGAAGNDLRFRVVHYTAWTKYTFTGSIVQDDRTNLIVRIIPSASKTGNFFIDGLQLEYLTHDSDYIDCTVGPVADALATAVMSGVVATKSLISSSKSSPYRQLTRWHS